jgi:hypothetical protein
VADRNATQAQQADAEQVARVQQIDKEASERLHLSSIDALDQATPTLLPESQSQMQSQVILAAQPIPLGGRRDK